MITEPAKTILLTPEEWPVCLTPAQREQLLQNKITRAVYALERQYYFKNHTHGIA